MQSNIDENGEAKLEAVQSNIDKKLSELKSKENIQFRLWVISVLYKQNCSAFIGRACWVWFGMVWFG